MTIEELNYKLTGIENPRYLTSDQKMVIEHCLVIINEIEQNSHKHSVMQTSGADVSEVATVGNSAVGQSRLDRCWFRNRGKGKRCKCISKCLLED